MGASVGRMHLRKSSRLIERTVGDGVDQSVHGWESGAWSDGRAELREPELHRSPPPPAETVEQLLQQAEAAIVGQRVSVTVTRALIDERSRVAERPALPSQRETLAARLTIGPRQSPAWSRAAQIEPSGWQPSFLRAAQREAASWRLPTEAPDPSLTLWLDSFAVADLLRFAAHRWLIDPPPVGSHVAGAGCRLLDRGSPFPRRDAQRVEIDAIGQRCRPLTVLEQGRVVAWPDRTSGSTVRPSWRSRPRLGWRSLEFSVDREADQSSIEPPRTACVVTRLLFVGGTMLAAGFNAPSDRAWSRFDPRPVPSASWWLLQIAAGRRTERLIDLSGVPVKTAPVTIEQHPNWA